MKYILWSDLLYPQPLFMCLPHFSILLIITMTSFLPHMRHTVPEYQVSYPLIMVLSATCCSASLSMDQLTMNLNEKLSVCDMTHLMTVNKINVHFSLWWQPGTMLCCTRCWGEKCWIYFNILIVETAKIIFYCSKSLAVCGTRLDNRCVRVAESWEFGRLLTVTSWAWASKGQVAQC